MRITTPHLLTFYLYFVLYYSCVINIFSKTYFICNSSEKEEKNNVKFRKDYSPWYNISSSTYLIPYVFLYAFFHLAANIDEIIGWLSVFSAVHSSAQFHSKIISFEYKTQKQYAHKPYFYYNIYIANTESSFSIFIPLDVYSLIRIEQVYERTIPSQPS